MKHAIADKDSFEAVHARPNWVLTWLLRLLLFGLMGLLLLCLFMIPVGFALDDYYGASRITNVVVIVFSHSLLLGLLYLLIRHIRSLRRKSVVALYVDREGIHYRYADGHSDAILYKDLQCSNEHHTPDVYAQTQRRGPTLFRIFVNGGPRTVTFMTDIGRSYYTGNQRELIGHFVRGIRRFRPDLHVGKNVFSEFYIHPDTFAFDGREWVRTWVAVILILILVLFLIDCYMSYRFGASLIFD
ncbi:hypothetical protein [Olivibacter sitiensis]|uniref:hypothetical protein n=1 Tax=Olivibacter sitiensis TaxID=376470 RepID=UPI0012F77E30|nr:hypothetical protein [Olivibacter sitiensis]